MTSQAIDVLDLDNRAVAEHPAMERRPYSVAAEAFAVAWWRANDASLR